MAIVGIELDRKNPQFRLLTFTLWLPQFKNYMATEEGIAYFNMLKKIANQRIFKSIWGIDWEYAMSLCIAHYLDLIAQQAANHAGNQLGEVSGGGAHKGLVSSANIGGFSKTIDFDKTMVSSDEALFWNKSDYGATLMALYKTKAVPSIFVVNMEGVNKR